MNPCTFEDRERRLGIGKEKISQDQNVISQAILSLSIKPDGVYVQSNKSRPWMSEKLQQRVGGLFRLLLKYPVAGVLDDHDRHVSRDQFHLLPQRFS
jgi:hypothetical protein